MNIYKPPKSAVIDEENQNQQKMSVLVSIGIFVLNLFVVYLLVFGFTGMIKYALYEFGVISTTTQRLVVDAILSLVLLTGYFCLMIRFRLLHGFYINLGTAGFYWLYWYIESGYFKYGFSNEFPLWYEVNMAFNDIAAVVISVVLMKGRLLAAEVEAEAMVQAQGKALNQVGTAGDTVDIDYLKRELNIRLIVAIMWLIIVQVTLL